MGTAITQIFPPAPTFTEKEIPSLLGKVFIVTGGNSGVGLEVVKILYSKGSTVYIASRSPTRIAEAIEAIKSIPTATPGNLKSLHLDLADLTTVATCVSTFLAQESRLDVLWNNAGVAQIPAGTLTTQGYEVHIGTNCLGPFLLTKLLLPILVRTAKVSPQNSVRVVFTTSGIIDMSAHPGGLLLAELTPGKHNKNKSLNYSSSKAGDWFLASEFHNRVLKDGIVCVTQSPGTLKTASWDKLSWPLRILAKPLLHEPKMGAYTELWCGLNQNVTLADGGKMAIPWGRWHPDPKRDILQSLKTKEEGGTGLAAELWDWCEEQTRSYA